MSRTSLTPLVLPADPVAAMEAATKQYVDSLAGGGTASPQVYSNRYRTTDFTLTTATYTTLSCGTVQDETAGISWSAGVYTLATIGTYLITSTAFYTSSAAGRRDMRHMLNGVAINYSRIQPPSAANSTTGINLATLFKTTAANQTISVEVYQNSGGNLDVIAAQSTSSIQIVLLSALKGDKGDKGDTGNTGAQGAAGLIVLATGAPVPGGTPAGTVVVRT
jgi:hypothetical protein